MAEITREQIEKLRGLIKDRDDAASDMARWPGYEYDEAYRQASDRLHSAAEKALPALLDLAASALARGGAVESATDQSKGGDANADLSATSGIQTSPDATSPGRECEPAGASEELCRRLALYALAEDILSSERHDLEAAASLIRRLERERNQWQERESETQETLQAIGEEFGAYGGEPRTDAMRRLLTETTARATAAEAEAERLRAALAKIADWNSNYGPFPEGREDWGTMAIMTAREIIPNPRARTALEGK